MILNWSRLSLFAKCQEKAWNTNHTNLSSWEPELPLMQGAAFHDGVAQYFAKHSIDEGVQEVSHSVDKYLEGKLVLPEEKPDIEHARAWSQLALRKFCDSYEDQPVQVLWPEVQFCVAVPASHHHCFEFHKRYSHNTTYERCPVEDLAFRLKRARIQQEYDALEEEAKQHPCWQPHWFRGKTDAVVQYLGGLWLFEHKTNSIRIEQFIKKFYLDAQTTGYLYGLWKSLGVKPDGFILNVIQKPHPNSKDQMQVGFAREVFERSDDDLAVWEGEFRTQADSYERAFRERELGNQFAIVRNTQSCMDWGRECPFLAKCKRSPTFEPLPGEFLERQPDYVDTAYAEVYSKWLSEREVHSGRS